MPLDVLLHHMREMHWQAVALAALAADSTEHAGRLAACRNAATQMAKDAAPYVHAKLVSSEITGKDGGAVQIAGDMSDQELARRVAIMLAPKPLTLMDIPASQLGALEGPKPIDVEHSAVDSAQVSKGEGEKPSDNSVLVGENAT